MGPDATSLTQVAVPYPQAHRALFINRSGGRALQNRMAAGGAVDGQQGQATGGFSQIPGQGDFAGCFQCGDTGHRKCDCPVYWREQLKRAAFKLAKAGDSTIGIVFAVKQAMGKAKMQGSSAIAVVQPLMAVWTRPAPKEKEKGGEGKKTDVTESEKKKGGDGKTGEGERTEERGVRKKRGSKAKVGTKEEVEAQKGARAAEKKAKAELRAAEQTQKKAEKAQEAARKAEEKAAAERERKRKVAEERRAREAERKERERAEWKEREQKWKDEWESMNQRAIENMMRSKMDERLDEMEKKADGMLGDKFRELEQKMTKQIETGRETDKVNTQLDIRDLEKNIAQALAMVETDLHTRVGYLESDLTEVIDTGRQGLGVKEIEDLTAKTMIRVLSLTGNLGHSKTRDTDIRHQGLGLNEQIDNIDRHDGADGADRSDKTEKGEEARAQISETKKKKNKKKKWD